MRILIDIGHPAHVHYFKNFIWEMQKEGHEFMITARNRSPTFHLLRTYGLQFVDRGKGSSNILGKLAYMPVADMRLYLIARKYKPDLFLSFGSIYSAHASKLYGVPHIAFDDTEHASLEHSLYVPFTDLICTPSSFKKDFGKKHIRFNGYMELCYLHPNRFKPNPSVLKDLNLKPDEKFFVLRFVSWEASHDRGQRGLDLKTKRALIQELEHYGRVVISSENPLSSELEKYRITSSPENMHSILYYSAMYIGEGATMASEAAVLGTPSVYINTLKLGYLEEQDEKYNLTRVLSPQEDVTKIVGSLLATTELKEQWQKRRDILLSEKIDVTPWMMKLVSSFFESSRKDIFAERYNRNPR